MKTSTIPIIFISLTLLCACTLSPTSSNRLAGTSLSQGTLPPSKDGACHAKCIIKDKTEKNSQMLAVYTGNEHEENVDVKIKEIILKPANSTWVKKRIEGCVSSNPFECEVACLVETPAITKKFKVLIDSTQSKNFEMQKVMQEVLTEKGGYTEWRQVVCANDRTPKFIGELQLLLVAKKYYTGPITNIMDTNTNTALIQFQRDNDLPIGQLDFETLDMLGILVE